MSEQMAELARLISWPGQCCDGYCMEEFNIHAAETEADCRTCARRCRAR